MSNHEKRKILNINESYIMNSLVNLVVIVAIESMVISEIFSYLLPKNQELCSSMEVNDRKNCKCFSLEESKYRTHDILCCHVLNQQDIKLTCKRSNEPIIFQGPRNESYTMGAIFNY